MANPKRPRINDCKKSAPTSVDVVTTNIDATSVDVVTTNVDATSVDVVTTNVDATNVDATNIDVNATNVDVFATNVDSTNVVEVKNDDKINIPTATTTTVPTDTATEITVKDMAPAMTAPAGVPTAIDATTKLIVAKDNDIIDLEEDNDDERDDGPVDVLLKVTSVHIIFFLTIQTLTTNYLKHEYFAPDHHAITKSGFRGK
jgi:hypothetical protein